MVYIGLIHVSPISLWSNHRIDNFKMCWIRLFTSFNNGGGGFYEYNLIVSSVVLMALPFLKLLFPRWSATFFFLFACVIFFGDGINFPITTTLIVKITSSNLM